MDMPMSKQNKTMRVLRSAVIAVAAGVVVCGGSAPVRAQFQIDNGHVRDANNRFGSNGANDGQTIKLNGVTYPKGIGANAPSDVVINLDPNAKPLADWIGAIPDEIKASGYDLSTMRSIERRDYTIECNWKVYVDNYLEGYHLPIAHPGLFKELEYDNYRVETFRYYSKQHAPIRELKPGEVPGRDRRYIRMPGAEEDALYYWIFPNTMLNIYQDNVSTKIILPLSAYKTLTIFDWYLAEPGTGAGWESMQQTIAFSDEIQQEDIAVCEQVQRGLRSRSYERGRFSALRENGVFHFQSLVTEFLDRA